MLDTEQFIFERAPQGLVQQCRYKTLAISSKLDSGLSGPLTKPHRNNLRKATPVNAARRAPTLTLERFLEEEDPWKKSLVDGPENIGGTKERSFCSLKEKNMSAKISEGINGNEYTGE